MLTKDLLRVSRAGGGYQPEFAGRTERPLAARVIGVFQGNIGESRVALDEALETREREADDFKLVRGFAALLEREAVFETVSPLPPERVRRVAFEVAAAESVVRREERERALERAGERLGTDAEAVERSLYADRDARQILTEFDLRWDPDELVVQYNLSLAQTALFDAKEVRIRSSDPRALVSAVKGLGLMYEIRKEDENREVVITGPDALFRSTRRYGTRFARLLRTVAKASEWQLTATIDDRGTERTMHLSDEDPIEPLGAEGVPEVSFDSSVEADFAARFDSLDLDWELVREPEPLATGHKVMIPDFAFDYKYADFRMFFEIMGFWTPEYVEKKLAQLEDVEDVEMLISVDESLGVSEQIEARDHRAIPYSGSVRLKDVRDALRRYEDDLVARSTADLPDELLPDADAIKLTDLADEYGVSETAIKDKSFPEHERVGQTLVRPAVLDELAAELEPGLSLSDAEELLAGWEITESSAALSRLGYEVMWEGLGGGTLQQK